MTESLTTNLNKQVETEGQLKIIVTTDFEDIQIYLISKKKKPS